MIATASIAANCASMLGGVVVFGDPIGSGLFEGIARGAAFAAVIAAAALMQAPVRALARPRLSGAPSAVRRSVAASIRSGVAERPAQTAG